MQRALQLLRVFWSLTWGFIWVWGLHGLWKRSAPSGERWVIGGHRGRHYGDNAAAVEAEARRQGKDIVWIANPALAPELQRQGVHVLPRQSWAARRAISQASVLIYSHGEDDLDLQLILLRKRTALRVYLGHSLSLLKAGGVTEPAIRRAPWPIKQFRTWLITRWDAVLCASEEERSNFELCYPMNPVDNHPKLLAGGAHLDFWRPLAGETAKKRIYWFPTFRDTAEGRQQLAQIIRTVVTSDRLRAWLTSEGYEFLVGAHINDTHARQKLKTPFREAPLSSLTSDARQSELLISDYSGVVFDHLLLERPQILFAFDLDDYQKHRVLYGDYRTLDFAFHAQNVDELITAIVKEKWRDQRLQTAATKRRHRSLPAPCDSFSARSVEAITWRLQQPDR